MAVVFGTCDGGRMQRILAEIDNLTGQLADVRNAVSTVRGDLLDKILSVNRALTEARADITTLSNSHRNDIGTLWTRLREHASALSRLEASQTEQRVVKIDGLMRMPDGREGEGLYLSTEAGQILRVDAGGKVSLAEELHDGAGRLRGDVIFMYDGLAFTYNTGEKFDRFAGLRELMDLEARIDGLTPSHSCGCEAIAADEIDTLTDGDPSAGIPPESAAITTDEIDALVH